MLEDFKVLRRAWEGTRQSIGGLAAMAGFDFQLARALQIIIEQEATGGGTAFLEVLSDIVKHENGFVIGQAKRTLSSSSFKSALDELWSIEELARSNAPTLVPHLRYQVLSAQRSLSDWSGSLARWSPMGADAEQLRAFKTKVSISVEPSPRQKALKLLIEQFRDGDALNRFDRMLGRLLSGAAGVLDRVVEDFRIELRELRIAEREAASRFGVWGVDDQPPSKVICEPDERRAVRIGERLTVRDLREGRLATRSIYTELNRSVEEWLAREPDLYKLPLYWIGGRSGCGKSATLLHAAASLHREDADRLILWLGQRADLIGQAVRWAAPDLRNGRSVVLVVDDPFTAERQTSFQLAAAEAQSEWEAIDDASGRLKPPAILCCGPTEQGAAAEDACAAIFTFSGFEMPLEAEDDYRELAKWYSQRTGNQVVPISGNALLVQQMFEWTKGSISDFAGRFRQRIQAMDGDLADGPVFNTVAEILALNRLYVEFPYSSLAARRDANPRVAAALIQLGDEEAHFDLEESERGGVRLTHPHLADAIYRAWFDRPADRAFRKAHLAAGLEAALGRENDPPEIRHAPLWAIARLSQPTGRRGRKTDPAMKERIDLIRNELKSVLASIAQKRLSDLVRPFEDLPVWVALDDALEIGLPSRPAEQLADAVSAAVAPARGLRLSCHRLLAVSQLDERNIEAVAACLNTLAKWRDPRPWHDWAPLALDLVQRCGPEPIIYAIAELTRTVPDLTGLSQLMNVLAQSKLQGARSVVVGWLQRTPTNEFGWAWVLTSVLMNHGHCDATDALADRFLLGSPEAPQWPLIWSMLFEQKRGDVIVRADTGRSWLTVTSEAGQPEPRAESRGWDRVWSALLTRAQDEADSAACKDLEQVGLAWLVAADPYFESWTRVWPRLWELAGTQAAKLWLADVACNKLASAPPTLSGWSLVWTKAFDGTGDAIERRLIELGRAWIAEASDAHLGWVWVYEKLLKSCTAIDRGAMIQLGLRWLRGGGAGHRGWMHVLTELLDFTREDPERNDVVELAHSWLIGADPGDASWPWLAGKLLEISDEIAPELRTCIVHWLRASRCAKGWPHVATALLSKTREYDEAAEFRRVCADLLLSSETDPGTWVGAWHAGKAAGLPTELLLAQGLTFVERQDVGASLRAVICSRCFGLAETAEEEEQLIRSGLVLVEERLPSRSWPALWDELTKRLPASQRAELVHAAAQWLTEVEPSHPDWNRVFARVAYLDRRVVSAGAIMAPLTEWLELNAASDQWLRMWRAHPERNAILKRSALGAVASQVLEARFSDRRWSLLWRAKLQQSQDDRLALRQLALNWLSGRERAPGYGRVWQGLLGSAASMQEVDEAVAIGISALGASPPVPDWFWIFSDLAEKHRSQLDQPAVLVTAECWLMDDPTHASWSFVFGWRQRRSPSPWPSEGLMKATLQWLKAAEPDVRSWSLIWREAMEHAAGLEKAELRELGARWLESVRATHEGWPFVWASCWRGARNKKVKQERLRQLGRQWLDGDVSHRFARLVQTQLDAQRHRRPAIGSGGRKDKSAAVVT